MVIVARLYTEGSEHVESLEPDAVPARVGDHSILWLDGDPGNAALADLADRLGLAQSFQDLDHLPIHGADFRAETISLSVLGLEDEKGSAKPVPLRLVLARNIVVSLHEQPVRGLADPVRIVARDPRFGRLDAGRFAGLLLDGVLDGYDAAFESLEREIDALDERALSSVPDEGLLSDMVALRRRIAVMRRSLAPQRAVHASLTRDFEDADSPIGTPDAELLAHVERTIAAVERLREQLLGSFDILMTRTGQRTNDIVRVLTVVSAVLLPSSVIAGVMGMNFQPRFFEEPALFFVVVGVMIAIAASTLAVARWRGWI